MTWPPRMPPGNRMMSQAEIAHIVLSAMTRGGMFGVLEVGCFQGTTTSALLDGRVTVVDTFDADPGQRGAFDRETRYRPHAPEVLEGNSHEVLPHLIAQGRTYGVILVDAGHEEEDAYLDCRDSWKLLAREGIMYVDDYNWPSVFLGTMRHWAEAGAPPSWGFASPKLAWFEKVSLPS